MAEHNHRPSLDLEMEAREHPNSRRRRGQPQSGAKLAKAVGTGDFNGDGLSDILWQNAINGQVSIWEMDGNIRVFGGGAVSPSPGPSWRAIGPADGGSDILFQSTNGQIAVWEMDGH